MFSHIRDFTDHGEEVRVVHRAVPMFAFVQVGSVKDSGNYQAKVSPECVDGHGAARILGLGKKDWFRQFFFTEQSFSTLIFGLRPKSVLIQILTVFMNVLKNAMRKIFEKHFKIKHPNGMH